MPQMSNSQFDLFNSLLDCCHAASYPPLTFTFVIFDSKPVEQVNSAEVESSHFTQLTLLGKYTSICPLNSFLMCRCYCRL